MRRIAIVVAVACIGHVGAAQSATAATGSPGAVRGDEPTGPVPTVEGPVTSGNGRIVASTTSFDLAEVGYEASEWFVSGVATSYTSAAPLTSDGKWDVTPAASAPYTTRIVVHRPARAEDFNGTVVVEWFNVSGGLDAGANWSMTHTEQIRRGNAWVGVTAQVIGIEGRAGSIAASRALKIADPVRYGALSIPSDDFSYDIYTQVGRLLGARDQGAVHPLDGLRPRRLLAAGESQAAFYLTTYLNAIQPSARVYDGFLVHSRRGGAAALATTPDPRITAPEPTFIRDDLDVPVLDFVTESDLFLLRSVVARQPDSKRLRRWEAAGTAHYDTYGLGISGTDTGDGTADIALFATMSSPPASLYGGLFTCGSPVNAGPARYVASAAIRALDRWVTDGSAPPRAPRLDLDATGSAFAVDAHGNATGGIRTPHVDAPIATLSGVGQTGNSFCFLFGTTVPFDAATLAAQYPTHDAFVKQWKAATARAVKAGFLLPADARHLAAAAAQSTIGEQG